MKTIYTALITIIVTLVFFGFLSLVAYIEQNAINEHQKKFKSSWCNVDFGSSSATVECNKVNRLERK